MSLKFTKSSIGAKNTPTLTWAISLSADKTAKRMSKWANTCHLHASWSTRTHACMRADSVHPVPCSAMQCHTNFARRRFVDYKFVFVCLRFTCFVFVCVSVCFFCFLFTHSIYKDKKQKTSKHVICWTSSTLLTPYKVSKVYRDSASLIRSLI